MERKKPPQAGPPEHIIEKGEIPQRLLPGDFQKYLKKKRAESLEHYHQLDDNEKNLEQPKGFFTIPEKLLGEQDMGEMDFLVFYFDNHDDYALVRSFFERASNSSLSHPKLDSSKLAEVVRNAGKS
jgi:hypothetical protein